MPRTPRMSKARSPLQHALGAAFARATILSSAPCRGAFAEPILRRALGREGDAMATDTTSNTKSYIYLGLAGETGQGRVVHSGLCRLADGNDEWEKLQNGLLEAPAVRALAIHPRRPEIVYAGTQSGPYRSGDRGEQWEQLGIPHDGWPVWSILFHPHGPDVILVGYEKCEIYRSDDVGELWVRLTVSVRLPEITTAPGANPAKRVLKMDASASEPDLLYAAIDGAVPCAPLQAASDGRI